MGGGVADSILELYFVAATVWMEAQGEPWEGKRGVAWVIQNRTPPGASYSRTVLAPAQFSCWNTNSAVRLRLGTAHLDSAWPTCVSAAAEALSGSDPDPTGGATYYLRSDLNPKPDWYDASRVTATFGAHQFLKLP